MPKPPSAKQEARVSIRETFWPGYSDRIWPQQREKGWSKTPRTLPIVAEIINAKEVSGPDADLARTYLTLFCMAWDEGVVEINDEDAVAMVSGLKKKTWIARMLKLEALGFIEIRAKHTRRFGYVLLLHPVPVVRKLRAEGKVSDGLWALFTQWHAEYRCTEPLVDSLTTPTFPIFPGMPPGMTPTGDSAALDELFKKKAGGAE